MVPELCISTANSGPISLPAAAVSGPDKVTAKSADVTVFTVITAVLLCPPVDPVIVATPSPTPVTNPVSETIATEMSLLVQEVSENPENVEPESVWRVARIRVAAD